MPRQSRASVSETLPSSATLASTGSGSSCSRPPAGRISGDSRKWCGSVSRREIVVKGYHGWAGRALHTLSALYLAAPDLTGYTVRVILASAPVADAVARFAVKTDLKIALEPWSGSHAAALERLARARMMISIGISDGIGTTMLEAMALGAFPVVAATACAQEWIRSGVDGMIVDPHDVDALAQAITRAATDDALVDTAAARNREVVEHRWNMRLNRSVAVAMYAAVAEAPL